MASRSMRARLMPAKEEEIILFRGRRRQTRAARSVHLQHRRQRQLPDSRHHRTRIPQGVGNGLLFRDFSPGSRSGPCPTLPRGKGNIFFTGATASLRGGSGLRGLRQRQVRPACGEMQATARELDRKNIHVDHLIIDAGVDTEWVRQRRIEALGPDALNDPNLLMPPSSVLLESYWLLYQQPRSASTFELEITSLRREKW